MLEASGLFQSHKCKACRRVSEGLSPALHEDLLDEVERLYDAWSFRSIKGGRPLASDGSPIQTLLADLYELMI